LSYILSLLKEQKLCPLSTEKLPSKNDTMLRANATVIHLGKIDMVKVGSSPMTRPMIAVEYRENIVAIITDKKISGACLFTS